MNITARNSGILEMNQEKGFAISIFVHLLIVAGLIFTTSTIKPAPKLMVVDFNILENYVSTTPRKQIDPVQPSVAKTTRKPLQKAVRHTVPMPDPVPKKVVIAPPKLVPASKPKIAAIKQKKPLPVPPEKIVREPASEPIPEPELNSTVTIKEEVPPQIVQTSQAPSAIATSEKAVRRNIPDFPAPAAGKPKNIKGQNTVSAYTKAQFKHIQQGIQQLIRYPRTARRMGWEGKVVLEFIICKDGSVKDIGIIESSGFKALDKNAVATLKKAAPFPTPPIPAKLIIPVVYRLS